MITDGRQIAHSIYR